MRLSNTVNQGGATIAFVHLDHSPMGEMALLGLHWPDVEAHLHFRLTHRLHAVLASARMSHTRGAFLHVSAPFVLELAGGGGIYFFPEQMQTILTF